HDACGQSATLRRGLELLRADDAEDELRVRTDRSGPDGQVDRVSGSGNREVRGPGNRAGRTGRSLDDIAGAEACGGQSGLRVHERPSGELRNRTQLRVRARIAGEIRLAQDDRRIRIVRTDVGGRRVRAELP